MVEQRNERDDVLYDEDFLRTLLLNDKIQRFREKFLGLHPYDQSQFYEKVGPDIRKIMYYFLSPQEMAVIFREIEVEDETYQSYLKEMDTQYVATMLEEMYTDDAVDILNDLDNKERESYLEMMDSETADEINELLSYAEYTAGAIMTTEYVSILESSTVRSAMAVMRKEAPTAETIYYIFVVNDEHQLTGVMSLRDLIIADEDALIRDIMSERIVSVQLTTDQEEAAQIMKDYNFLALPVINEAGVLQGIITVDDIIDVEGVSYKAGKTLGKDAKYKKSTYVSVCGIEQSKEDAKILSEKAKKSLSLFPDGNASKELEELCDYLLFRNH